MRVGIFSWESLYSIKIGGIAPHVSELSEALVKRGHEVHIFTKIVPSIIVVAGYAVAFFFLSSYLTVYLIGKQAMQ